MTDNELAQMLLSGMGDVLHLQRYLNHALDLLGQVHASSSNGGSASADSANVDGARANLEQAHDTVDDVRDRMLEWTDLIRRMVEQRQSAADAYKAGYEARVVDIIARLSPAEYGALRRALIDLDKAEEIPF